MQKGYYKGYYRHKREVWDDAKCGRMARRIVRDSWGTPYPFRGFLPAPSPHGWGRITYNGGTVIPWDGPRRKWYKGEVFPLPKVAKGYKLVHKPTWGWCIVKCEAGKPREG